MQKEPTWAGAFAFAIIVAAMFTFMVLLFSHKPEPEQEEDDELDPELPDEALGQLEDVVHEQNEVLVKLVKQLAISNGLIADVADIARNLQGSFAELSTQLLDASQEHTEQRQCQGEIKQAIETLTNIAKSHRTINLRLADGSCVSGKVPTAV